MADIGGIPQELLLNISSHLNTKDFCSLRRTCSAIEKGLFNQFAKEFFSTKQFMLTRGSLQALIDISKHEFLSPQVKKIVIGTDWLQGADRRPFMYTDAQTAYQERQNLDQMYLNDMCIDRTMLVEAFSHLKNCREIEIRDYNSPTRFRDYPSLAWKSYGAATYFASSGVETELRPPGHLPQPNSWLNHIFGVTLNAVVESGLECEALMVTTRNSELSLPAFNIPIWAGKQFQDVLKKIKILMLAVHLREPTLLSSTSFEKFIALLPNLENLRLNFDIRDDSGSAYSLSAVEKGIPNAPLRRLELGKVALTESIMLATISKFERTLEELVFFRVRNLDGSWVPLLDHLQSLPKLRRLRLQWVKSKYFFVGFKRIDWDEEKDKAVKPKDLEDRIDHKSTSAAEMKDWLKGLKNRVVVQDDAFRRALANGNSEGEGSDDVDSEENSDEGESDESSIEIGIEEGMAPEDLYPDY